MHFYKNEHLGCALILLLGSLCSAGYALIQLMMIIVSDEGSWVTLISSALQAFGFWYMTGFIKDADELHRIKSLPSWRLVDEAWQQGYSAGASSIERRE